MGLLSKGRIAALATLLTVSGVVPLGAASGVSSPLPGEPGGAAPIAAGRIYSVGDLGYLDPVEPVTPLRDPDAKFEIVPPRGWQLSPLTSLDRSGDEDSFEVARFQLALRDPALYAQPVPVTSGLLADAGAVLSVALAREGGALLDVDLEGLDPGAAQHRAGVSYLDGETTYDGVVTFTRISVARDTGRTLIVRAYVRSADRDALGPVVLASIASAKFDPQGPLGPKYVPPPPPPPPAAPAEAAAAAEPDPLDGTRAEIIARASSMLGTPYVWGGNAPGRGMDCSAYVSAAWGVQRYSTDSLWNVAIAIGKSELLPGDAMDLETWRDPAGYGHIRIFEAWANDAHTLVWVYEETPPRAIHRVIAYDPSYRPMRLAWLSGGGVAPLVPAPAAQPVPSFGGGGQPRPVATRRPSTPRPTPRPTFRTPTPTVRTPAPAVRTPAPTVRPTMYPTPRPTPTPQPIATTRSAAPSPTVRRRSASPNRR